MNFEATASWFHIHKQTMLKKLELTLEIINNVLPPVIKLMKIFLNN